MKHMEQKELLKHLKHLNPPKHLEHRQENKLEPFFSRLFSEQGERICLICHGEREREPIEWKFWPGPKAPSLRRWLCTGCEQAIPWIRQIRCARCGRGAACPDCMRQPQRAFAWNRSAVHYDPLMREWLAQYKFRGRERLLPLFAEMMIPVTRTIADELITARGRSVVLTYIPLSRERQAERGFNQSELLAAYLGGALDLPVCSLLHRRHHTEKQSYKNRRSRLHALHGAFSFAQANELRVIQDHRPFVLIVDDVYTTGSTLDEASRVIRGNMACDAAGLTWARA
ncbi:ComF family protein [Xylanibacillus composti]|uniref:Amidophosphoribosyltransferase n=1 Tax=Xylanibacillus composti TaxID=1572762 RepID=A0A8J4H5K7_9BACL|nr:ComF family protein [Xylanibacillus composti]MDT9725921.1 ComF family protein [Xylanibacillus composti]GIQ71234.1 amidophosphoribosyltransferase [Xylanibacillus composti]